MEYWDPMSQRRPRPYTEDEVHALMKQIIKRMVIGTLIVIGVGLALSALAAFLYH